MTIGRRIDRAVRRVSRAKLRLTDKRAPLHFLHLSKNAGTQIKHLADSYNATSGRYRIVQHPHSTTLRQIPAGEAYFFSVRHPVSRFKSGFYSRKRQGFPKYDSQWTPQETRAFERFEHANTLAEALFADGPDREAAYQAMRSINHLARNQIDWFDRNGHFLELRPPLAILRQEAFDADLARLMQQIGAAADAVPVASDAATAHRGGYEDAPALSPKAVENIERWYAPDLEFYHMCCNWAERQDQG